MPAVSLFRVLSLVLLSATLTMVTPDRATAQELEVDWALGAGGEGADKIRGLSVAGGKAGNGVIFLTGEFGQPSADLFGKAAVSAGLLDFVLVKLSANGATEWVATAGGDKIDRGYSVVDAGDGGCFVTGHFESALLDFGNGQVVESRGDYDAFVARFSSTGKCVWAFSCGGAGYDYGHGIAADGEGGCVVSGAFAATGKFGETTFVHKKGRRAFIMRVTASGGIEWVNEAGAVDDSGTMSGHTICTDDVGNIFMAGFQRGGAVFSDTVSLEKNAIQDVFVASYLLSGKVQWASSAGGEADGLATSVAGDGEGGCYLAGMFKGVLRIGETEWKSAGEHDIFVARVAAGGEGMWAHRSGGEGTDYGLAMTPSNDGVLVTGELSDAASFYGKGSRVDVTTAGLRDAYVAEYSPVGELKQLQLFGGADNDLSYAIGATREGGAVFSGAFRNETQMGATRLESRKANDIFVTRLKRLK